MQSRREFIRIPHKAPTSFLVAALFLGRWCQTRLAPGFIFPGLVEDFKPIPEKRKCNEKPLVMIPSYALCLIRLFFKCNGY